MKTIRFQVSAILVLLSALALVLPDKSHSAHELSPSEIIKLLENADNHLSVDEVAAMIIREDTSRLFIDVRTRDQYLNSHIPGSVNMQLGDLLNPEYAGYLELKGRNPVFYSNGNTMASEAWMLAVRAGSEKPAIMLGGMNEWFRLVMESEFSGTSISSTENALFETRYNARKYFTQMNSLPDSLKSAFLEVKLAEEAELTGGCE